MAEDQNAFRLIRSIETLSIEMEHVAVRIEFEPSPAHGPDSIQFLCPKSVLDALQQAAQEGHRLLDALENPGLQN